MPDARSLPPEPTGQDVFEALTGSRVGILGLGGLGSHVSWILLRAGVRDLVLADHDRVEVSNLSRQNYYPDQVGEWKTDALAQTLRRIDPDANLTMIRKRIRPADLLDHFEGVDVLVEAVDSAEDKAALIDGAARYLSDIPVVGASGIAGLESSDRIATWRLSENVWVVGDLTSDEGAGLPLVCSRVVCAAAKQAHLVIGILLGIPDPYDLPSSGSSSSSR